MCHTRGVHNVCKINPYVRSHHSCCCLKAIGISYTESVILDFVIQHAKRMCRIVFSSVTCHPLRHPYTLFHKHSLYRKELNIEYSSGYSVPNVFESVFI
jgi:hypothetical protein